MRNYKINKKKNILSVIITLGRINYERIRRNDFTRITKNK